MARQRSQEAERVRVLRMLEDGRGVAFLDDLARVHHPDAIAHRPDDAQVVGDQEDRGVRLRLERANEVENARLDRRVKPGRRLVEDEQLGVRGERDGDDDALLHPARQLVRVALGDRLWIGDLDAMERVERIRLRHLLALAEHGERFDDLRPDLGRRIERGARVLVDHRGVVDPELANLVVAHLGDVVARHEDPSARDDTIAWQVAHGGVCRGRLPTARFADEAVRLTRPHLERDTAQHRSWDPAHDVGEREVLDLERGDGCRDVRRGCGYFGRHSFRTDWSESATRLTATTVLAMARAGKSVDHQTPLIMFVYSWLTLSPQSGDGG